MFAYYISFPYLCETIADKTQTTMKPVIGEKALQIANSFMAFVQRPPSVNHQPEIRDAMASTIQKAMETYWPDLNKEKESLESQVKELREAGNALIEAMNQYSFFADGYRNGSASISEFIKASEDQHAAYSKMFDVLKSLNKQP